MVEPVKTYSFQLPTNETVETVAVRLPNGRLVLRHISELVKRPTPPAAIGSTNLDRVIEKK